MRTATYRKCRKNFVKRCAILYKKYIVIASSSHGKSGMKMTVLRFKHFHASRFILREYVLVSVLVWIENTLTPNTQKTHLHPFMRSYSSRITQGDASQSEKSFLFIYQLLTYKFQPVHVNIIVLMKYLTNKLPRKI